jgi:uncharacterized protein (TIGR03437 family)
MRAFLLLALAAAPVFGQAPTITSIINAGSLDARFCPGVVATITGSNLGTDLTAGISVSIGGVPGIVTSVSPNQVNFAIPFNMYLGPSDVLVIVPGQGLSNPFNITLTDSAPAFLTQPGGPPALALFFHPDNSLVTKSSPARRGETIYGEFVGLGKVNREPPTGTTPSSPAYNTLYPATFALAGAPATVVQSLLVPGLVAVYRVDVQVPNDAPPGLQSGVLTINGVSSNIGVIPIAGPPSVQIETPTAGTNVSGAITVSGWALDNTASIGSGIGSVTVQVDGATVGTASYGIARYDICLLYPDRPRCPNVGFTYELQTASLSPGAHTVTVVAITTDAVASTGSANVTVIVGSTPGVYIDSPTAGSALSGIVTVTGWAVDTTSTSSTSAISGVQIMLDGASMGSANYGVSRPDVCATLPGRPGCPNVGFMYQLDTRGLAVGSHALAAVPLDSKGGPLPGTWTVNVNIGASPSVTIESPSAGSSVSGTITVSGWAIDSTTSIGTAIKSVDVSVDGVRAGSATYGASRPDVCGAYPGRAGCPNVGFSYALSTASLSSGAHTITVSATDSDGTPDTGSSSVTVNVLPGLTLSLESPAGGSIVNGSVVLTGWALAPAGASVVSVNVLVDGTLNGTATYGNSRPDVCATRPGYAGCPNVGFTYTLNLSPLSAGPHLVTITATDNEGSPQSNSTSVMVNVSGPLSVFIDSPAAGATVSGVVNVTGWALALAGGTPLSLVEVLVDDRLIGLAQYNQPRPEICASNPGRPGCPNVGFVYPLDTSSLDPGTHVLRVLAIDNGAPPNSASWSTTIVK